MEDELQRLLDTELQAEALVREAEAALADLRPDEPAGPPNSLKQRLITLLLADFVIFMRALSGAAREFLLYWAYRFELNNLKTVLRGKMTGQSVATIRDRLVDMGPFARLPGEDLLRTEDVALEEEEEEEEEEERNTLSQIKVLRETNRRV